MTQPLSDLNVRLMDEIGYLRGILEKCREFIDAVHASRELDGYEIQIPDNSKELLDEIDVAVKGKASVNYKKLLRETRQQLDLYRTAVNMIDDYLEYAYRDQTPEFIRSIIFYIIDELTKGLKEIGGNGNEGNNSDED